MAQTQTRNTMISSTGHFVVRMLVASYFLAAATGVIQFEAGRALMRTLLPEGIADAGFVVFLFTTSYLMIIGWHLRGAALMLSLFVFWASFLASFGPGAFQNYELFWRDLAFIGGLLMSYLTPREDQRRSARFRLFRFVRQINPRRVRPDPGVRRLRTGTRTALDRHREIDLYMDDEPENLFSEVFDRDGDEADEAA